MLSLYLVRHGETEWSLTGRHTGSSDVPLTAQGELEARELRPVLELVEFTAVLTSPLQRARQTCELAGLGGLARIEPDLKEWDYGAYEGRRTVDIHKERPDWDVFRDGCPQGELPADVGSRADRLIAELCSLDGNVALFSHGQFGSAFAARWIALPVGEARRLSFDPAALGILGFNPGHPDMRVISMWNATPARFAPKLGSGHAPGERG